MRAVHICTSGKVRKRRLLSKFGSQIRLTAFAAHLVTFFIQESFWPRQISSQAVGIAPAGSLEETVINITTILAKRFWDTSPSSHGFVWNLQLTCDTHS